MAKLNFEFGAPGAKKVAGDMRKVRNELGKLPSASGKSTKSLAMMSREISTLSGGLGGLASRVTGLNPALLGLSAPAAALGVTVAATAGAIGIGIGHVIQLGDELTTLSSKTDLTTDFLQKLSHASNVLDVDFNTAAQAASKLQINLGKITPTKDSLDALARLGLELDELKNLDAEQQFLAVGDAIKGMGTSAEQAAVAQALFGRGGIELLPLLRDNYRETLAEAEALGLVLSRDLLDAGDELGESWTTLKNVGVSLLSEAVGPLVKELASVSEAAIENRSRIGEWIDTYIKANPILLYNKLLLEGWTAALGLVSAETEDATKSAREYRDELAAKTRAEYEAFLATTQTTTTTVAAVLAAKDEKDAMSELGKFLGLTTKELEQMDAGFINVAKSMLQAEQHTEKLKKLEESRIKVLSDLIDLQKEQAENIAESAFQAAALADAYQRFPDKPFLISDVIATEGVGDGFDDISGALDDVVAGVGDVDFVTTKADNAAQAWTETIRNLDSGFQIFGLNANDTLGSLISSSVILVSQFERLKDDIASGKMVGGAIGDRDFGAAASGVASGIAGIASATSSGSTAARTGKGALAGAGAGAQVAGPIGAIVGAAAGAITGFLRGRSAQNALDAIENEVGLRVSEGMLDAIRDSGRPAQLMIADIFAEGIAAGTASVDDLAREMGDVFSFLDRGDISEPEAIKTLEASTRLLLENLDDLGPTGEEQVERIISAAREMGVEFDGLSELIESRLTEGALEEMGLAGVTNVDAIRKAAEELGIGFDTLRDKILGTFAPQSLEQMMETLGLTNAEARALSETLGIDVATNLELAALAAGLTVDEFKKLQEAAGDALGRDGAASMEELQALMDATGLSAQELAERLNVDVAGGAKDLDGALGNSNAQLDIGITKASMFADEMERARAAANGINFSGLPGGSGGGGSPDGGFAGGTPGLDFMNFGSGSRRTLHGEEAVIPRGGGNRLAAEIAGALKGAGGGGANVSMSQTNTIVLPAGTDEQQANRIVDLFERDVAGMTERTRQRLNG